MKRILKLLFALSILMSANLHAQEKGSIKGKVTSKGKPVDFVNVGLKGTTLGGVTDTEGNFEIKNIPSGNYEIRVSSVGYENYYKSVKVAPGTPVVLNIEISPVQSDLNEVVVTGTMKQTFLKESPIKVEVITQKFLQTNPTNNIIEAIQTVNGVQEQVNCGVCGTNDIHINGMEGPYTLVLIDGMPIVSALSTVYGFNGIPNNLIKRVEIVKGPASSLYGSEAVGGVINIITVDPATSPGLSLNTFYTSHREFNLDLASSRKLSEKVSTILSGNFYRNQYRMDFNGDNFTDIPLNSRISLFNKWNIKRRENRQFSFAARYYNEDRFGGVMQWRPEHRGDTSVYGESIYTNRVEMLGTYQLPVSREKIRVDYSFNFHDQNSFYGSTPYHARQWVYFSNFIWDKTIGKHDMVMGATTRYQIYDDNTPATEAPDKRFIPGVFVQDEIKYGEKSTLLIGGRIDHQKDHGLVPAPRVAWKYRPDKWTTIRLNSGKGFRLVNLFTEEHAALTGARTVVIKDKLKPEQSYNVNLDIHRVYAMAKSTGSLDLDFFYTWFNNKIIPDYNTDPNLIIYENLPGHAIVRGFALGVDHNFIFPLKVKLGMTYQDVFEVGENANGERETTPQVFAPKISGTFLLSYQLKKQKISFDYTGRVVGPQHLPVYEAPFQRPEMSPWYSIQNLQVTKEFKDNKFQVYGGVKNILNWTQASPLVDPQNPFGDNFDTAYAWGPLQTRRVYAGLRVNLK